jgi:hypothetical protein
VQLAGAKIDAVEVQAVERHQERRGLPCRRNSKRETKRSS